jgi:glycosidase
VIYFVLPDRFANGDPANDTGGIAGDRLTHGFDPADKGFYHGGDLKGLIEKLDYIQGLGASAIWVGPIFKNKPVQGPRGRKARAITAIGSPISCMSTRISGPTRISPPWCARPMRGG